MDAVWLLQCRSALTACLVTATCSLIRPTRVYYGVDVRYGTVAVSDSGWSLSVLSVVVVVVYTWSATVNVTVIKPRGVQQKLMNILKVNGQRSAVVRGVVRLSELWNGWADGGSTDCRPLSVTTSSKCRNRRVVCRATVVAAWLPATSATAAEVSCTTKPTAQIEPKTREARFWLVCLKCKQNIKTRWLHCMECPQYSIRLKAYLYTNCFAAFNDVTYLQFPIKACISSMSVSQAAQRRTWFTQYRTSDVADNLGIDFFYGAWSPGEWFWIDSNVKSGSLTSRIGIIW